MQQDEEACCEAPPGPHAHLPAGAAAGATAAAGVTAPLPTPGASQMQHQRMQQIQPQQAHQPPYVPQQGSAMNLMVEQPLPWQVAAGGWGIGHPAGGMVGAMACQPVGLAFLPVTLVSYLGLYPAVMTQQPQLEMQQGMSLPPPQPWVPPGTALRRMPHPPPLVGQQPVQQPLMHPGQPQSQLAPQQFQQGGPGLAPPQLAGAAHQQAPHCVPPPPPFPPPDMVRQAQAQEIQDRPPPPPQFQRTGPGIQPPPPSGSLLQLEQQRMLPPMPRFPPVAEVQRQPQTAQRSLQQGMSAPAPRPPSLLPGMGLQQQGGGRYRPDFVPESHGPAVQHRCVTGYQAVSYAFVQVPPGGSSSGRAVCTDGLTA